MKIFLYFKRPSKLRFLSIVHFVITDSDCFFFFSVALIFLPAADIALYVSQGRSVNKLKFIPEMYNVYVGNVPE